MTTKFLAISLALASILPTYAIAEDKTGPSHPSGGNMNPNDGVCTTICAHANGAVTLEGEICPPY